jgi:hypothetical protein
MLRSAAPYMTCGIERALSATHPVLLSNGLVHKLKFNRSAYQIQYVIVVILNLVSKV